MKTDTSIPRFDLAIDLFETSQRLCIGLQFDFALFTESRIKKREALCPVLLIEPLVHLLDSSPKCFSFGRIKARTGNAAHGLGSLTQGPINQTSISGRTKSSYVSRRRMSRCLPPSTSTSAARGR